MTIAGTIEEFDPSQFAKYLAVFLFVSFERVEVEARPASVLVTAEVVTESINQAREARVRLDALNPAAASELFNMTIEGMAVRLSSSAAEINAEVIATALTKGNSVAYGTYGAFGGALIICICTIVILQRRWKQRAMRLRRSQGLAEKATTAQRVSFAESTDPAPSSKDCISANAKMRSSSAGRKTSGASEKLRVSMSARDLLKRSRRSHRDSHSFCEQETDSQPSPRDCGSASTSRQQTRSRADTTHAPQKTRRGTVEAPPCRRAGHRRWANDDVQPTRLPAPHHSVLERLSMQESSVEQAPYSETAETAETAQRRLNVTKAESATPEGDTELPVYLVPSSLRAPSLERHSSCLHCAARDTSERQSARPSCDASDVSERRSARVSCAASDVDEIPESGAPGAPIYCTLAQWRQVVRPVESPTSPAPTITLGVRQPSASPSPHLSRAVSDVSERHRARLSSSASDASEGSENGECETPIYCTLSRWPRHARPDAVEPPTVAVPTITPAARQSSASRLSQGSSACSRSSRRRSSAGSVVEVWSSSPEPQGPPPHPVSSGNPSDGEASGATSTPNNRLSRSSRRRSSVGSVVELWSSSPEPQGSPPHPVSAVLACSSSDGVQEACIVSSNDAPLCGTGGCGPTATPVISPPILKSNTGDKGRVQRVRI